MTVGSYRKHHCPIAQALAELGDQWTLLIVRDALLAGRRRFNEFQESLGISRNLLAMRLAQLCDAGILERVPLGDSKRHAYEPTQKCRDIRIVLLAMAEWGEKWATDPDVHRLEIRDKKSGRPVALEFVRTEDGKIAEPDSVEVIRPGNGRTEDGAKVGP